MREWAKEICLVTVAYLLAFFVTFRCLTPLQNSFFPEFPSHASLLFLPHGVRVLSAWLLGWRSVIALTPGVMLTYIYVAGWGAFAPSRLLAVLIAVTVPAATFHALKLLKMDISPDADRSPCWHCVVLTGVMVSLLTAGPTNLVFGSPPSDYLAYVIGDFFGLFFLMSILMFFFRSLRKMTR